MSISGVSSSSDLSYLYQLFNTKASESSSTMAATFLESAGSTDSSSSSSKSSSIDLSMLLRMLDSASGMTNTQGVPSTNSEDKDFNPLANDLNKLGEALDAGDLEGAQNIFSQMMQHMPPPPPPPNANTADSATAATITGTSSTSSANTLASDFGALGKAIQSGDLTSAQSFLTQLQEDLQAVSAIENTNRSTASSSVDNFSLGQLLKTWASLTTANNETSAINASA